MSFGSTNTRLKTQHPSKILLESALSFIYELVESRSFLEAGLQLTSYKTRSLGQPFKSRSCFHHGAFCFPEKQTKKETNKKPQGQLIIELQLAAKCSSYMTVYPALTELEGVSSPFHGPY